jgi:hypothetical protein
MVGVQRIWPGLLSLSASAQAGLASRARLFQGDSSIIPSLDKPSVSCVVPGAFLHLSTTAIKS